MKTILLSGNSIWFDGLADSLPEAQALHVVRADPADVHRLANSNEVDLVVMDETPNMDLLSMLHTFPAAVLLVVDLATGRLTVVHGQSYVVSTMQEVVQLIRGITAVRTRLVLPPSGGASS